MQSLSRRTVASRRGAGLVARASSERKQRDAETSQNVDGVNNFGRITDTLYRGAQPSSAGFAALHHIGVSIVVNFRNDGEAAREKPKWKRSA